MLEFFTSKKKLYNKSIYSTYIGKPLKLIKELLDFKKIEIPYNKLDIYVKEGK